MVLTRLAKVLLCLLGIGLPPLWQESFAQNDPRAAPGKEVSSLQGMGRVSGRVRVGGSYDKPKPLPVFKNRSFCGCECRMKPCSSDERADCGTRLLRSILLI